MFERYTEKARRTIFFARYEASQFGSPYIEPEHFLLGIMREDRALFLRLLPLPNELKLVENEIRSRANTGVPTSTSVDLPLSHETKRALAYAAEESARRNDQHIGPGHLLFGLLIEPSIASVVLGRHGVTQARVREELALPAVHPSGGTQVSTLAVSFLRWQFAAVAARLKPENEPANIFLLDPPQKPDA